MMHAEKFREIERQAWLDNNPLAKELSDTRAEIVYLLRIANAVASRYDAAINNAFDRDDYASTALWATFINHIDSLERESGENL